MIDFELVVLGPPVHEGEVFFVDLLPLHEEGKMAGSVPRFGDQGETAGLSVEAVDDGNLAAIRDFEGEQAAEVIPHRGRAARFARMHQEMRRLVDDEELGRFIDEVDNPAGFQAAEVSRRRVRTANFAGGKSASHDPGHLLLVWASSREAS